MNNTIDINDILKYVKDNWDDAKFQFPYLGKGEYAIPEFTLEVERDILALALLEAYDYISGNTGNMCEKIMDGGEYCPDFFQNDANPCMGCRLYWLIGQGAEKWVAQKRQTMNETPNK